MDTIAIKVLGTFDILVNDRSVISHIGKSNKGSTLLRYLILHRDRQVSHSDLYDVLWPNEDRINPENALKTLISRLRGNLKKCSAGLADCILTVQNTYQWNNDMACTLDIAEFERLCGELKNVNELSQQTGEMFHTILKLYKGDLFDREEQDTWVISRSVYLHHQYEDAVYRYLELLQANEEYDEVAAVCRSALEVDAFNEKAHIALMNALVKTRRINEALMQYKHAKSIHLRYLGIQPPKGILDFYMNIIQSGQVLDMDIDSIRNELRAYDQANGAFVCEYAVFKEIYNLQLRSFDRTKRTLYLALIMLKSVDGKLMDPLKLDDLMGDCLDVLTSCLRKGDTITHYSASQYALLLPLQSTSEGQNVIERIKAAFYRKHRNSSVIIDYRLGLVVDTMQNKV